MEQTTRCDRCLSVNCTTLYIRCWGHDYQTKFYFIGEVSREYPAPLLLSDNADTNVLFDMRVEENTQHVSIANVGSAQTICQSLGGLVNNNDPMKVMQTSKNAVVGTLTRGRLLITYPADGAAQCDWRITSVSKTDTGGESFMVQNKSRSDICGINSHPSSATIRIHFFRPQIIDGSTMKVMMIILAGLKAYYTNYKFHQQAVPAGILPATERGSTLPSNLSTLKRLETVIIRASCENHQRVRFFDVFDALSHKIILIATIYKINNRFALTFKNAFQAVEFTFSESETGQGELIDSQLQVFGVTIKSSRRLVDTHEPAVHLEENIAQPKPSQPCERNKLRQIRMRKQSIDFNVAEYYQQEGTGVVQLSCLPTLDVRKKALILTRATIVAILGFQITKNMILPAFKDYEYREW